MTSNQKDHIKYSAAYIQRYWNGQLSQEEMHALEKAALDDPFLADAIEGIGETMQQFDEPAIADNLELLHGQLQAKASHHSTTAPVRSIRWWQIAASVVVVAGATAWLFISRESVGPSPLVGKNEAAQSKVSEGAPHKESAPPQPATAGNNTANNNDAVADSNQENRPPDAPSSKAPAGKEARPLPDQSLTNAFTPADTASVITGRAAEKEIFSGKAVKPQSVPPPAAKTGLDKEPVAEVVKVDDKLFRRVEDTAQIDGNMKLQDFIKGVVTDHKNNPLPYAFLRVDNYNNTYNNNGYTTDLAGNFKIPVNSDSPINVTISSPGYTSRRLRLQHVRNNNSYSYNHISLEPSDSAAGLVMMGYRKKGKSDQKDGAAYPKVMVQEARPLIGWIAYEEYLAKNKNIPADLSGIKGTVVVSFEVNKKGKLSAFRVEKSLSKQHDAEALRLVKQGPAWKLNKGRKARVMVIVRF